MVCHYEVLQCLLIGLGMSGAIKETSGKAVLESFMLFTSSTGSDGSFIARTFT